MPVLFTVNWNFLRCVTGDINRAWGRVVIKDLTAEAKAKAKDLTAEAKAKDLIAEAKATVCEWKKFIDHVNVNVML